MQLQLTTASFADASLGAHSARTEDGQTLSVLFDHLVAESLAADNDAAPQVRRAEGVVACKGSGWVSVQLRGATALAGPHGYAHAIGWANGRRLRAAAGEAPEEPFASAVVAPVGPDGLRLSLLLLAQRDLSSADSGAACWVDSIDIAVVPAPRRPRGASRS